MPLGYFVLPSLNAVIGSFRERVLMALLSLYLTTTLWRTYRNGNIVPRILHRLDTRCKSVMRFLFRPFYSRRYKVRYPAHRGHSRVPELGRTFWRTERNRSQKHPQNKSRNSRSSNEGFFNMHTIHNSNYFFIFLFTTNYNFASCFVWVWNLVANIEGRKEAEGLWEYGVEENIWT